MRTTASYGSWRSPISSDVTVVDSVGFSGIVTDENDVYWIETRPFDQGRNVVVKRSASGNVNDVTYAPYDVRSRVHEYGGGALAAHRGTLFFSNFEDQRLYRQRMSDVPEVLTPYEDMRYADGVVRDQNQTLICVREDHTSSWREPISSLVSIDLVRRSTRVLVSGNNFYSNPRISPDGQTLAWIAWNHPNMPWDGTELWLGRILPNGLIGESRMAAGGREESIYQPEWSPDGSLYFISDRNGWWNIYRLTDAGYECVHEKKSEFGLPQWTFGSGTYGFVSERQIFCAYNEEGQWLFGNLDIETGQLREYDLPFTDIGRLGMKVSGENIILTGGSPDMPVSIVSHNISSGITDILRSSTEYSVDEGYLSRPINLSFPSEGGSDAHGFYYPPSNKDFQPPSDEKPPLMVISHGGPTGATGTTLNLTIQFWTSRGFAVLDVNYRGSTGFGREYRRSLNGNWGIADVDDCVNGATYLITKGLADAGRLIIRGSSAGGYTTLAALTFRSVFGAGASYYGISDLVALAEDTHKFESRYLDTMVGSYPLSSDIYMERSPINHTDQLSCPIILFHGLEDKVVPPNQAKLMFDVLREKNIPVAYMPFEGEQHGFRRGENIRKCMEAELYFYSKIFGFTLAECLMPIEIENLSQT